MSNPQVQRYWAEVFELDTYRPAPVADSLEYATEILARLQHVELALLPRAPEGPCDDCDRPARRRRVGLVCVCSKCALRRTQAMRRAA
jgi:hypothetical protein